MSDESGPTYGGDQPSYDSIPPSSGRPHPAHPHPFSSGSPIAQGLRRLFDRARLAASVVAPPVQEAPVLGNRSRWFPPDLGNRALVVQHKPGSPVANRTPKVSTRIAGAAVALTLVAITIGAALSLRGPEPPDDNLLITATLDTATPTERPVVVIATVTRTPTVEPIPDEPLSTAEVARSTAVVGNLPTNGGWVPHSEMINGTSMALVPAGCFVMGSLNGDEDEQPIRTVCITRPYWIDVMEVTNGAYRSNAFDCRDYSEDAQQPRVCINWEDAKTYCESRGARLPTEAEWEYAARGPEGFAYPWGFAFVEANTVWKTTETQPVGSIRAGASWVGALDLSGNVREWVNDWYGPYSGLDERDPGGPASGSRRVARGGAWNSTGEEQHRGMERWDFNPGEVLADIGFRCAADFEAGE